MSGDASEIEVPRKYRPSNGTEGMGFIARWCAGCVKDGEQGKHPDPEHYCPILTNALMYYSVDQEYPSEWTYDATGLPCCTAFDDGERPDPNAHLQAELPLDGHEWNEMPGVK